MLVLLMMHSGNPSEMQSVSCIASYLLVAPSTDPACVQASQIDFIQDPLASQPTPSISLPIHDLDDRDNGSVSAYSAAIKSMNEAIDEISTTMPPPPAVTTTSDGSLQARNPNDYIYVVTVETIPDYCTAPLTTSYTTQTVFTPTVTLTRSGTMTGYPSVHSSVRHLSSGAQTNRTTAQATPTQSPFSNNSSTLGTTLVNVYVFAMAVAILALLSD